MKKIIVLKNNLNFLLKTEAFFKRKGFDCKYLTDANLLKNCDCEIVILPFKKNFFEKTLFDNIILFYPEKEENDKIIPNDVYWIKENCSDIEYIYTKTKEWMNKKDQIELIIDDTKNDSAEILKKCISSCIELLNFFSKITVLTYNNYNNINYKINIINLTNNKPISTKACFCLLDSRYKIDFGCIDKLIKLYKNNKNKIFTNVADKLLINGKKIKNYIGQDKLLLPVSSKGTIYPPINNIVFNITDSIEEQLLNVFKGYSVIHSLDMSTINNFKISGE